MLPPLEVKFHLVDLLKSKYVFVEEVKDVMCAIEQDSYSEVGCIPIPQLTFFFFLQRCPSEHQEFWLLLVR